MTSQAETLFRIEHLHKSYEMGEISVQALHDVNLEICQRELIVMLGPSGSGKSTMLNILGGLDTATSGNVHYQDHDLTDASEKERTTYRREHVGFVFQFYNLIPSLTAKENVEIVTEIARDPMPAEEALAMVGLQDRANGRPGGLFT